MNANNHRLKSESPTRKRRRVSPRSPTSWERRQSLYSRPPHQRHQPQQPGHQSPNAPLLNIHPHQFGRHNIPHQGQPPSLRRHRIIEHHSHPWDTLQPVFAQAPPVTNTMPPTSIWSYAPAPHHLSVCSNHLTAAPSSHHHMLSYPAAQQPPFGHPPPPNCNLSATPFGSLTVSTAPSLGSHNFTNGNQSHFHHHHHHPQHHLAQVRLRFVMDINTTDLLSYFYPAY